MRLKTFLVAIFVSLFLSLVTAFLIDRYVMPWYVKLKEVVEVPDVRGMEMQGASEILIESGLNPYLKGTKPQEGKVGLVIDMDPSPGMRVKKGRKVGLWVSSSLNEENVP